jgi:hypothetical protein
MRISITLCALLLLVLSTPDTAYPDRTDCSWNDLIESSEIIASAYLMQLDQGGWDGRPGIAKFMIGKIYKGEPIQSIDVITVPPLTFVEDSVSLSKLGKYILFLRKDRKGIWSNYDSSEENFLRVELLNVPKGRAIPVISEESYRWVSGIPKELFTEKEIRLGSYGKIFDFKARLLEESALERWLEKNILKRPSK